ncbi:unnamed protein product [Arctia plantaginis]|uniref:Uncharacterized protein n=1 Tax=Arctia plantaginis TaxID=874455 RepID=A0A8S0Z2F4_ARCPL|nr:unnamed protein product [Arctia plantaginis]
MAGKGRLVKMKVYDFDSRENPIWMRNAMLLRLNHQQPYLITLSAVSSRAANIRLLTELDTVANKGHMRELISNSDWT